MVYLHPPSPEAVPLTVWEMTPILSITLTPTHHSPISWEERSRSSSLSSSDRAAIEANYLLKAAVQGTINGLVFVTSMIIHMGVTNQTTMVVVSSLAQLLANACSTAIHQFLYTKFERDDEASSEECNLPRSLVKEVAVSALAYGLGGLLPLLIGGFVRSPRVRLGVVCVVTSLGLSGLGAAYGILNKAPVIKSTVKVLIGEWMVMFITYMVLDLDSST